MLLPLQHVWVVIDMIMNLNFVAAFILLLNKFGVLLSFLVGVVLWNPTIQTSASVETFILLFIQIYFNSCASKDIWVIISLVFLGFFLFFLWLFLSINLLQINRNIGLIADCNFTDLTFKQSFLSIQNIQFDLLICDCPVKYILFRK